MLKIKVIGQMVQTDKQIDTHTHTDATKRIISPVTRSIINMVHTHWLLAAGLD